ncbi:MAG TPA: hypothetical protein DCY13_22415, partial [Verrucomicrobiales bacterium]|nr:hypothetical protein [Verrucomicrobiales bacterium]
LGGCFLLNEGASLDVTDGNFTGSVMTIGAFDVNGSAGSGFLTLDGATNNLTGVALNNYGTLFSLSKVNVKGSQIFANHGTIVVPSGGRLHIASNAPIWAVSIDPETQVATSNLVSRPGTINASATALLGGTWQVGGLLLIDGASFVSTGADPGPGSASSGYVDNSGAHINPADDVARALSYGLPANVILDGAAWNFPAILPLSDSGGIFSLINGAVFNAQGSFTNRGNAFMGGSAGSSLLIPGHYVQAGPNAETTVQSGGTLASLSGNYQILGGQVTVANGASMFGLNGSQSTLSGVSLTVASTLNWTFNGIPDPANLNYVPDPCGINLPPGWQINTIGAGASVTLRGSSITFDTLSANLRQVDGSLTVMGEGLNPGFLWLSKNNGQPFINNGGVEVSGYRTELQVSGDYIQNSGTTVVRKDVDLVLSGDLVVNGGRFIVELGIPDGDRYHPSYLSYLGAPVSVNGDGNLNNHLVVRFVDVEYADLGDAWVLFNGSNMTLPLPGTVTFEGITLAPQTRLEIVKDPQGLKVVVKANNPTVSYLTWLAANGIPNPSTNPWSPDKDTDNDGISDGNEFLFDSNPRVANSVNYTLLSPGIHQDGTGERFYEITYVRPAGSLRRNAHYTAYLTEHVPADLSKWRPGVFKIVGIVAIDANTERVTLRSTVKARDTEQVFVAIGGELLDLPRGLTAYNPFDFGNPGDLYHEELHYGASVFDLRPSIGRVFYIRIPGRADAGTVYGGAPEYYDRSNLGSAVVHGGLVRDQEHGVVKVTLMPGLPDSPAVTAAPGSGGRDSQSLSGPTVNSVAFTVEPAYP